MSIQQSRTRRSHAVPSNDQAVGAALPTTTTRFLQVLWALEHENQAASRHVMRTLGLSAPQLHVLRVVGMHGTCGPTEVASFLQLDRSSVTSHFEALRAKGLLAVNQDPNDRRRLLLRLTARGRRFDRVHRGSIEAIVDEALRSMPLTATEGALAVLLGIIDEARGQLGPARRTWKGSVRGAAR